MGCTQKLCLVQKSPVFLFKRERDNIAISLSLELIRLSGNKLFSFYYIHALYNYAVLIYPCAFNNAPHFHVCLIWDKYFNSLKIQLQIRYFLEYLLDFSKSIQLRPGRAKLLEFLILEARTFGYTQREFYKV